MLKLDTKGTYYEKSKLQYVLEIRRYEDVCQSN